MIRQIHIVDFKAFSTLNNLRCAPLTLLSGVNSSGKSTVLQAMLLLRQSAQQGLLQQGRLALNGDLAQLGTATDVLNERSNGEKLELGLSLLDDTQARWMFAYDRAADVLTVSGALPDPKVFSEALFDDRFHYLSADRLGPRTHFEMSEYQVREHQQLGSRGEFSAHYLAAFGEKSHLSAIHRALPRSPSRKLRDLVEAWLSVISPGVRLRLTPITGSDVVQMSFAFATSREESSYYRPTNVGFGLTYTLPILVALLSAKPGHLVLLENPEAHLHPRGQAQLGRLLALCAADGVQVIVETHSDHVLNGIRLAVRGKELAPDQTAVHFFERIEAHDGAVLHTVTTPLLDKTGRFDRWPDGFFDEWERSLDALLSEPQSPGRA